MKYLGKPKFLRNITPLLLSHHPNCSKFENHVFHVGKIKICAGCSVVYPTILVSMIVVYIMNLYVIMPFEFLLFTGILFSIPRIAIIPKNNVRKAFKTMINLAFGMGVSLCIFGIFTLPFLLIVNLVIFILFFFLMGFVSYSHFKKIITTCNSCIYHRKWSACPGFKELYMRIRAEQKQCSFKIIKKKKD